MEKYTTLKEVILNGLSTLSHLIQKGGDFAREGGKEESLLITSSLAPNMYNLTKQIQIATDDARRNLFLLAGKEHIKMEDTEISFAELKERVQKTIDLVKSLKEEDFTGADERHISLYWMGGKYVLGKDFVSEFAYANFFFHLVTVYDILRKEGVQIGKMDFITKFSMKENQ